jgi:hypothetical protein
MMRASVCENAGCVARVARSVPRIESAYMTLHRIAAWAACLLLLGVGTVADADTLMDDFEDPEFTEALWDVKQGDWRSEDGWWHGFSPAIGQGPLLSSPTSRPTTVCAYKSPSSTSRVAGRTGISSSPT